MYPVRLSPSGPIIGNLPGLDDGAMLRNVYFGAFPNELLVLSATNDLCETFNIPLPLVLPGDDPPEVFDPAKLLYVIWTNVVANTGESGATDGASGMTVAHDVDNIGGTPAYTGIEDIIDDVTGLYSNMAGAFGLRSAIHSHPVEGNDVDVVDATKMTVFRPGTIPNWVLPATPWVRGDTRHIYVHVTTQVETGVLALPSRQSRIVILEFYGTVPELIGVGGPGGAT
jgi:hypothetical protein